VLPPISEQQKIVTFLDSKTSQIDELIQKKIRKIELLKEYRTALINQIVTKGLYPNVKMKDSGVEWIGEIPFGWELRKGSTLGKYSKGSGIKKDEVKEQGFPCIRYGEIYSKYNHRVNGVTTYVENGVTDVKVGKGALFMTGSGETLEEIGKCVVYLGEEDLYVGGDIIILKPNSFFDPEFLSYQINSECIRIQRELHGRGGIIVHIYPKNFKEMWFSTPTLSEQRQIVSYLDEQTEKIESSIQLEKKKIKLLKEYRQSLISEVVTGKMKVF
jgi:type I restriction enzyme S subunit